MRARQAAAALVAMLVVACTTTGGTVVDTRGSRGLEPAQVAWLDIPPELILLSVDGEQLDSSPVEAEYRTRLAPGEHRLVLAYEHDWGTSPRFHEWVYSDHSVEVTLEARAGQRYVVGYPVPNTQAEASELGKDLRIWVDGPGGERFTSRQAGLYGSPPARLLRSSMVETPSGASPAPSGPVAGVAQAEQMLAQQDALERLKLWWRLASESDRTAFRAWINQ